VSSADCNPFLSLMRVLRLSRRWCFKSRSSGLWRHVELW